MPDKDLLHCLVFLLVVMEVRQDLSLFKDKQFNVSVASQAREHHLITIISFSSSCREELKSL